MAVDPNLADILKELQAMHQNTVAMQDALSQQNSGWSQLTYHTIDFFVILAADVFAAGIALVTFEAWRRSDEEAASRANQTLDKIGRLFPDLLDNLKFDKGWLEANARGALHSRARSDRSKAYHDTLNDPDLNGTGLIWEYPAGKQLRGAFRVTKTTVQAVPEYIERAHLNQVEVAIAAVEDLEKIRQQQLDKYARGNLGETWKRFFIQFLWPVLRGVFRTFGRDN